MGLSAITKRTNVQARGLFLAGLLGLAFLFFKAGNASAACVAPIGGTITSTVLSAQTIQVSVVSSSAGTCVNWSFAYSTDNVTRTVVNVTTASTTATFTFSGLATGSLYYLAVAQGSGASTSSYVTSTGKWTFAATPGTPTVTALSAQSFSVLVNTSSNVNNNTTPTTYIVRDTASSTLTKYLSANGTWGSSTTTISGAILGNGINATTTTGLATNTFHIISVAAVNPDQTNTTTFGTAASAIYTFAATPGVATVTSTAVNTLNITIDPASNPQTASTTYVVQDTVTGLYLQAAGTWGATTSTLTYAQLGSGSASTTTGLVINSSHTIKVAAVNGDSSATTSYSTGASAYTLASTPSSTSVTASANGFTFTWTGDGTYFYANDLTGGTNSGWITGTTYQVNGVNCGTSHYFTVQAQNGDGTLTTVTDSVNATTNGCGTGVSVGGGGGSSAQPAIPAERPATPAQVTLPVAASPIAVFVHTLAPGSRGGEVKALQAKLRELGYFNHSTDTGLFGSVTKAALVAFQKAEGLKVSGAADAATRDALNGISPQTGAPVSAITSPTAMFVSLLNVGSNGSEVKALQSKLRELGYFTYPTDTGSFGVATRAAVKAFQKAQGLSQVGWVGPSTRAALNSL